MSGVKSLIGSATRYIAGRNAVQTVYWRGTSATSGQETSKLIKVSKTLQFKTNQPERAIQQAHNGNNMTAKFD